MEAGGGPDGEPCLTAEWESSHFNCTDSDPVKFGSSTLPEDVSTAGHWSHSSISRSLQRAEVLLRSTFNPNLRWLFQSHSQDEEEENFVVAPNLVSRSSTRLLRLQHVLLTVAPWWQLMSETQAGSPQVRNRVLSSYLLLQGQQSTVKRLLVQRSLLLFIHEYTRRAHLAAAYISRVAHLLDNQLRRCQLSLSQASSHLPSLGLSLGSLSQELRVHLTHWPCLFSRIQSDPHLRLALLHRTALLRKVHRSLDSFRLQALVLMEQFVFGVLSVVAKTDLDFVPKEVLEQILAGVDWYNQAVEEQRLQHSGFQLRTAVLQQAHYSTLDCFPPNKTLHPSTVSVKELLAILAVQHAEMVSKELLHWGSERDRHVCPLHHHHHTADPCSKDSGSSGVTAHRSEMNWEQLHHSYFALSPQCSVNNILLQSSCQTFDTKSSLCIPDFHLFSGRRRNDPVSATQTSSGQRGAEVPTEAQTDPSTATLGGPDSTHRTLNPSQRGSPPATPDRHVSALPLSEFCQVDNFSVERLFQALATSTHLLHPMAPHRGAADGAGEPPCTTFKGKAEPVTPDFSVINTSDSEEVKRASTKLKSQNVGRTQKGTNTHTSEPDGPDSSCCDSNRKPVEEQEEVEEEEEQEGAAVEQDSVRWPPSVQWSDLGRSVVFSDLLDQYFTLLRTFCSEALWLQLHVPPAGGGTQSINFQDVYGTFHILHRLAQAANTGVLSEQCSTVLRTFSGYLLVVTAHTLWDYELCRSLGSSLKDKCLPHLGRSLMTSLSKQGGAEMTSLTTGHLLSLPPPLLSALSWHQSGAAGFVPSRLTLRKQSVSLVLAWVQQCTVWVMSKAFQFLSSWSLSRFLLVSQGDLKMLNEALQLLVHHTKSVVRSADGDQTSTLHHYHQLLLRQQLAALERAQSELQNFSSCVLRSFSCDCKRMSGEIFERTMPSAIHWRPGHRTGFPSSPSEYASLAAQTVIGQVLEGVAPLPDDVRAQALSITMTAFMEAWMEHILKRKIKFSVQGALRLKQDFDSIREMIQSDTYGLSADLHQRLLHLRVFQQADSAVTCLLQQPQNKSYLHSGAWEPFTRCCPASANRDSIDAAVSSNITNLTCTEGEDVTLSYPSMDTADLPPVDPSTPEEPYLAPSVALGAAQQQWLDLRIHNSARRWRLPGLQCLSKAES